MRPTDMKAMMQEALMLMRPGDVFEFTMPPPPENTADPVLIYEIALERYAGCRSHTDSPRHDPIHT